MRAIEIANMFIRKHGDDVYLTNLKLNKLVYYAQVTALRKFNRVLFDDPIEAWQYGPVETGVYHVFSIYGSGRISRPAIVANPVKYTAREIKEAEEIVDLTVKDYGELSAYDLVVFSHRKGSAWDRVFTQHENSLITSDVILSSKDGLDLPNLKRSVAFGVRETERAYPNALRLLKDS